MTTGEKIRKRRLELKMTMEELGQAIGVQRSAINKYEKGIVDMKSSTFLAIARALNVQPIDLMDDDDIDEESRTRIPIVVPSSEQFVQIVKHMSSADYKTVMEIFEKTYKKMQEEGIL